MPSGIYKRTKHHGDLISKALRKVGHNPPHFSSSKSSNWQGGRIKRSGYIYVHKPDHPFSSKQGYIAEHRLIMEKGIGRHLNRSEVIHHINGIKTDNRIENLKCYSSPGQHILREHPGVYEAKKVLYKDRRFSPKTEFKKGRVPWNKKLWK